MIKVLFISQLLSKNLFGGVETKMTNYETMINSTSKEIEIKLFDNWKDMIENYDIVHLFNITSFPYESYMVAKYAKERGLKVVVNPIFYQDPQFTGEIQGKFFSVFWEIFRILKKEINLFRFLDPFRYNEELFKISDIIIANTYEESFCLNKWFKNIHESNTTIIHNDVSHNFKNGDKTLFIDKYNIDNFILFVGRIEPRKNVLRMIKAFKKSNLNTKLVIIGKISDFEYYEQCKKAANENVIFIKQLNHNSELLRSAYKSCKVLILPSFLETPGRSALEGGLAGANIVITKIGGTEEYFKDYAWYVDPKNEDNIMNALIEAYNTPKSEKLSSYIEKKFIAEEITKKYIKMYKSLMDR